MAGMGDGSRHMAIKVAIRAFAQAKRPVNVESQWVHGGETNGFQSLRLPL